MREGGGEEDSECQKERDEIIKRIKRENMFTLGEG